MGIAIFTKIIISPYLNMTNQLEYHSLTGWCFRSHTERSHIQSIDSETDFSSDSDYDEFANEILQLFQFEPVFAAAERPSWY